MFDVKDLFRGIQLVLKGEVPIGTVHTWADGHLYRKVSPGKWQKTDSRGAPIGEERLDAPDPQKKVKVHPTGDADRRDGGEEVRSKPASPVYGVAEAERAQQLVRSAQPGQWLKLTVETETQYAWSGPGGHAKTVVVTPVQTPQERQAAGRDRVLLVSQHRNKRGEKVYYSLRQHGVLWLMGTGRNRRKFSLVASDLVAGGTDTQQPPKKVQKGILDEPMPKLCPKVWEGNQAAPTLKVPIKAKILKDVDVLMRGREAEQVFVVGSLTGYRYGEDTDLDVTIVIDVTDAEYETMKDKLAELNGKPAPGTEHPVNYYLFRAGAGSMARFDAAYDVVSSTWVKPPKDYGVDLFQAYEEFKQQLADVDEVKGEAWRSLIDIEKLRDAVQHGANGNVVVKLRRRLEDLNTAIDDLTLTYEEVHQERIQAFKDFEETSERGEPAPVSPNLLPENVRYKLFERYQVLDFLKALHDLVKEIGDAETQKDLERVKEIMRRSSLAKGAMMSTLPGIFKEVGFGEILEKFQAKVGEVRQWAGGQYKKVAPGRWQKITEGKKAPKAELPEQPEELAQHLAGAVSGRKVGNGVVTMSKTPQALVARIKTIRGALENSGYHVDDTGTRYSRGTSSVTLHQPHKLDSGEWAFAVAVGEGAEKNMSTADLVRKAKDDATTLMDSGDLKDQARRFLVGHMENLARISGRMGTREERKHERKRVGQEWDKITHDKRKGASEEEAWGNHLDRMRRMAESIKDPGKALRRARHMESAGFGAAAQLFYGRAKQLGVEETEMEKSALIGNLDSFNDWVLKQHKYIKRVLQPDGTYRYFYDEPKARARVSPAERELARFAGPATPSGGSRELTSAHHTRPYKELREMSLMAHLGPGAYVKKAEWPVEAPKKWHQYNRDVGMLEGQAAAYHNRGMKMESDYGKSEAERKLWLATSMMFRDAAKNLAAKRDLVKVPAKTAPSA